MSYLLDTNVISELVRPKVNENVLKWFRSIPDDYLHISVLTLGEIRKAVENVTDKTRKEQLNVWLEHDLKEWFKEKILPIDQAIADIWGKLQNQKKHPIPVSDSLIAATALHHNLQVVTRNIQDFQYSLLEVINPWNSPQ
jgi:hypothetical protein